MALAENPAVNPAVITASASVVVAVVVFVGNQLAQLRNERRQWALSRVDAQLRELYGPLFGLVSVNEELWRAMRGSVLPAQAERSPGPLGNAESARWQSWLEEALMPANRRMRDLILQHADLIVDNDMPQVLRDFCSHVASYEVLLSKVDQADAEPPLVRHPGQAFVDYVGTSFTALKERQRILLDRDSRLPRGFFRR
ncbi:hypothetical protein Asp14428_34330 [Actinoplanes sp. NBRC 14428]|nr:hypothetical protein Asp14428_34330 [Actinoplanes sp. NBRC 14428]